MFTHSSFWLSWCSERRTASWCLPLLISFKWKQRINGKMCIQGEHKPHSMNKIWMSKINYIAEQETEAKKPLEIFNFSNNICPRFLSIWESKRLIIVKTKCEEIPSHNRGNLQLQYPALAGITEVETISKFPSQNDFLLIIDIFRMSTGEGRLKKV